MNNRKIKTRIFAGFVTIATSLSIGAALPALFHKVWNNDLYNGDISEVKAESSAYTEEDEDITDPSAATYLTVDELLYPDEPENFDNVSDPYGLEGTGRSKVLDPLNELVEYKTSDYDYSKGYSNQTMSIYQDLSFSYSYTYTSDLSKTSTDTINLSGSFDDFDLLSYVKAEPFDPTGSGRDDHLAIYGINIYDFSLCLMIYDVKEKVLRAATNINTYISFFSESYDMLGAVIKDYFDITHGDYDGDGKDTLVLFASTSPFSTYNSLYEYEYTIEEGKDFGKINVIGSSKTKLLHQKYTEWVYQSVSGWNESFTKLQLRGELQSGDINNDGIDDLVMISNVPFETNTSIAYFDRIYNAGYLGVTVGSKQKTSILDVDDNDTGLYMHVDNTYQNEMNLFVHNPGVTIGDVDGTGLNCIVAAGSNMQYTPGSVSFTACGTYGIYKIQYVNGKLRYAINNSLYQDLLVSLYSMAKINTFQVFRYQTYKVQAFAYHGLGYVDAIYLNGYVFTLANSSSPTIINEISSETTAYRERSGVPLMVMDRYYCYVDDVIVGNFTNTYGGYQQIIAVENYIYANLNCLKLLVSTSCCGYVGGDDGATPMRIQQSYAESIGYSSYFIASTDCDNDGAEIRLNQKAYLYSDVKPVAVLQAAPFFEDLYDNDHYNLQDSGDTSITISYKKGTSYGESSSYEEELGVYCTESAIVETLDMTSGGTDYFEEGWEESLSYEVSESFHSGSVDTVVVYQVPLYLYIYDVYNAETDSWVEGDYVVYVEGEPLFSQLTVTEYNKYASYYQSLVSTGDYKLKDLNVVPLDFSLLEGNEGNPYAYNMCSAVGESFQLGHDGGYSSYSYSIQKETSSYKEESYGTYYNLSVGAGFSAFDCGGYVGVNYATNEMASTRSSTVTGKGITIEAIVGDIRGFAFEAKGYDLSLSRQYGFTWRLGIYDTGIKSGDLSGTTNLMIYSYVVGDIYEPVGAPTLTSCEYSDPTNNEVTIKWTAPKLTSYLNEIKGYNVYTYETVDGVSEVAVRINDSLIDADVTSYSFIVTNSKWQRFFVRAVTNDSASTEGLRSNEGNAVSDIGIAIRTAKYVTTTSDNGNIYYVYNVTYNNGINIEELYLKSSEDNNGVLMDISSFLYAKDHGFTEDYDVYISSINCLCSYVSHLYTKDNIVSVTTCEGPTITSYVCAICGHAHYVSSDEGKGHNYKETVVAPTCSSQGYTIHICKDCGDVFKDSYTLCTEHTLVSSVVSPTRTSQGYTINKCLDCNYYYYDNFTEKLSYNEFYSGHGEPSSSLGLDGDSYVDADTYNFYEKENGVWTVTGSVKESDIISIENIEKTKSEGLVDTYTITYSDGSKSFFTVTNTENGVDPTISINSEGYWVVNGIISDIKAVGEDGKNGSTPSITISEDGYFKIDGIKTSIKITIDELKNNDADKKESNNGKNIAMMKNDLVSVIEKEASDSNKYVDINEESTPYIGENGNWFIGDIDTGIKSHKETISVEKINEISKEGNITTYEVTFTDGTIKNFDIEGCDCSTAPYIGSNGNWIVNGQDSGIKAVEESAVAIKINLLSNNGNGATYKVTYTDGSSNTITVNANIDDASAKMIFKGYGEPSNGFCQDGRIYVDTLNWVGYRKIEGKWTKIADLKETVANSVYVNNGYLYIGNFKTPITTEGNEGKNIKTASRTLTSEGRYNFHVIFTDGTEYDYLAPESYVPGTLTTGLIDPVDNIGNDFDVYLNVKSMCFYKKIDGKWQYQGSLNEKVSSITNIEETGVYDKGCVYTITYNDETTSNFVVALENNMEKPTVDINEGGYWVIDGNVTDVLALGSDGKSGNTLIASSNGKWAINGVNTGVDINFKESNSSMPDWAIILISVCSALVVVGAIFLVRFLYKRKHKGE